MSPGWQLGPLFDKMNVFALYHTLVRPSGAANRLQDCLRLPCVCGTRATCMSAQRVNTWYLWNVSRNLAADLLLYVVTRDPSALNLCGCCAIIEVIDDNRIAAFGRYFISTLVLSAYGIFKSHVRWD